ncbi:hypothetical protein [Nocardioides pacificus]
MTYNRRTRLAAAVAGTVMLTATAACGGDDNDDKSGDSGESSSENFADKSLEEIQDAALKDMGALESVRMAGTFSNDGSEMSLDLQLNTAGDCAGTIALGGAEAEIIGLGEDSYLKGTEEFWTASVGEGGGQEAEAIIAMIGDKWAKVPDGGFTEVCDLDAFLENLEDEDDESESAEEKGEVVGETEVDGTPAIEISSEEDGEETTVWVGSEEGKHYILKMTVPGGDEPGEFTFSEFDEPIDVEAPADDEVVDLANAAG